MIIQLARLFTIFIIPSLFRPCYQQLCNVVGLILYFSHYLVPWSVNNILSLLTLHTCKSTRLRFQASVVHFSMVIDDLSYPVVTLVMVTSLVTFNFIVNHFLDLLSRLAYCKILLPSTLREYRNW